jgi:phosphatidylserine synthase 2
LALLLLILNLLARSTFLESLAAYFFFEIPDLKSRGALIGTVFAFICFASIHFPNTLIVRPHPIFWRVILGAFSLYAMLMTYLFLLPLEELQQSLKYFDPKLGQSLP